MDRSNINTTNKAIQRATIAILGIRGEVVRKLIHFLICVVPFLASMNKSITLVLIATGIIFYTIMEKLRQDGVYVLIFSDITAVASRERDKGKFVLGPVTLGLGAMLALSLYPEPAGRIAIYALAFGDGFASLIGKLVGGVKIPLTRGKTLAGSLACFIAVAAISYRILGNLPIALSIGFVAALLEALPTEDFDNILIPVGTGFFVSLLLGIIHL